MSKPMQEYEGQGFKVTFDPNVCTHSGNCVRGLSRVFDVKRRPWVDVSGAAAKEIEGQVGKCPSGALRYLPKSR